ncbi:MULTISPECIES: carbohydrate ABC transporter permease [Streptomyces]|uniref:carbohydrate ABC transporter permease n=1 Tax=Streptomyces lycopersici TaxID=2974589 RepID=UPI0021D11494|nr:sugar ABC transporter permease [Streptomyces sp. NEAU-383]
MRSPGHKTPEVTPRARGRRPGRWSYPLVFASPGLLVHICFVLAPILLAFGYSLTNADLFHPDADFVGAHNYTTLLSDDAFLRSLRVTTVLTLIIVVLPNVGGIAVALLLDRPGRLYKALRGVFFVPVVLSSVVVSVVWMALLSDDGLINTLLRRLGATSPPGWLSDPDLALYTIGFVISWQMLGFCSVVYLAGLQGVPKELLESAAIDGAGPWLRFRKVTWPMLAPAMTLNTVMLLITGFKAYDHVQVLTAGGPGLGTTSTIAFNVIQTGFTENRTGLSSAMAILMMVIVAVVSSLVLQVLKRREVDL